MPSFDYEQSIWGRGTANLSWFSPTSFRLQKALNSLSVLPSASNVLEVGCGAGQFIRAVKKNRPDLDCFGCDISQSALDVAQIARDGVFYDLSGEKLPYADEFFDAILIFDVLEHAEKPEFLLAEINRVLKRGGIFYCFVPCEGDWTSFWNFLRELNIKGDLTKKYAGHINYFSRRELLELFAKNNFKPVKIRYSEHILGQKVGIISFLLMDRAAVRKKSVQINNEDYFAEFNQKRRTCVLRKIVNFLINLESFLFQIFPSPNTHFVLKKF